MKRGGLAVMAVAVVVGAIAAGALLAFAAPDNASKTTKANRPGAPEAEDHSTHDLDVADRAVRRFLAGYLPVIYGHRGADLSQIRSATPELLEELRNTPSRVPAGVAGAKARVEGVTLADEGPNGAYASARIKSPSLPAYPLILHVTLGDKGWLVARIGQ